MVEGRSNTDRLLGELIANVRNLEKSSDAMNAKVDALREDVDGLRKSKWIGKGILITLSSAGTVLITKLPALITAIGK